MKVSELEIRESVDGELYFRLPDDLLDRLGWEEGDDLKFIPQNDAFIIKKVKYETIELDFDDEELLKYMQFAHEKNITFNELCEEAIKQAVKQTIKENINQKENALSHIIADAQMILENLEIGCQISDKDMNQLLFFGDLLTEIRMESDEFNSEVKDKDLYALDKNLYMLKKSQEITDENNNN